MCMCKWNVWFFLYISILVWNLHTELKMVVQSNGIVVLIFNTYNVENTRNGIKWNRSDKMKKEKCWDRKIYDGNGFSGGIGIGWWHRFCRELTNIYTSRLGMYVYFDQNSHCFAKFLFQKPKFFTIHFIEWSINFMLFNSKNSKSELSKYASFNVWYI